MRYFTIPELCKSEYGRLHNIANVPTEYQRANLVALIENVLDPLRALIGKPIIVNSGFRSMAINMAIGGVAKSQHRLGEAADIVCAHMTVKQLSEAVIDGGIPFDQMINEYNRWLHISYKREGSNRYQFIERK